MSGSWHCIGASVIGPGHIRNNLPNQDAWLYKQTPISDCAVVADGLGSKQNSDVASWGICKSVIKASDSLENDPNNHFDPSDFLLKAMYFFGDEVNGFSRKDCATTCLICLRFNGKIHLAMLGDGLLAAMLKTGEIVIIKDDKSDSFANLVSALDPESIETDWLYREINEDECKAILLCTDGVGDDLVDVQGFFQGFVEAFAPLDTDEASQKIQEMLENWPVPKHSDDKTLVCLFSDEVTNG